MLACAHLVARAATPFSHLGNRLQIHTHARFSNGINGGSIGLQSVQGCYSILSSASA